MKQRKNGLDTTEMFKLLFVGVKYVDCVINHHLDINAKVKREENDMFIKIKGEQDEDVLVNTRKITFIVSHNWSGSVIDFGDGTYIRSNTSITDIEKMIEKTSKEN